MSTTYVAQTELTTIHCGECGGTYAIQERYRRQKEIEGGSWNCPYCRCGWGYSDNNENARLKRELERQRARAQRFCDEANTAERRRRAAKGQLTKVRNRIGRGVCPCCNRTFQNLHRHMQNQHPEWASDQPEESSAPA